MIRIVLLISATLGIAASCTSRAFAQAPAEPEHLFLMAEDGLIVVQMQVTIDRWDSHAVWRRSLQNVFAALDSNGDGVLSPAESTSVAARERLFLLGGGFFRRIESGLSTADTSPRDDKVTPEELFEFFRSIGTGPVSLQTSGPAPAYDPASPSSPATPSGELWRRFDVDADAGLSAEEFALGWRKLRKLDRDEDETISQPELLSLQSTNAMFRAGARSAASLSSIAAAGSERGLAGRLLASYDREEPKDGKVSAGELGLAAEAIRPFDGDGDAALDFAELQQFVLDPPPSLEVIVRLGSVEDGKPELEVVRVADPRITSQTTAAALSFTRGSQHLEIAANVISGADIRLRYETEFQLADADGNGYLDRSEAARLQQLGALFNVLDADGDGQVYRRELLTFAEQQMEFARTRVTLMAVERGRDLFQVLDANGDERLGDREIQTGADLVSRWDANGDQRLSYGELPSQMMVAVELGPPVTARQVSPPPPAQRAPLYPAAGPLWLQRMDKNRDGEVSRREFLGPAPRFAELDANRDGAIDAEEAAGRSEK